MNQSYTSNHRITYDADEVPVTGGMAIVDYDVAFTYEYSAGDRTTPNYSNVDVDDAAVKSMKVFPGGGLQVKSSPEIDHERISHELDSILGYGPLPDDDEFSDEPVPGNPQQMKEALEYFWAEIAGDDGFREHMFMNR